MVNKQDIVNLLSEEIAMSKEETNKVVDKLFEIILEQLNNGEEVKVVGFGKFMVKQRLPRNVINPANKEVMTLPEQKAITFRPAKQAKTFLNK